MFNWKIIDKDSDEGDAYQARLRQAFPKVSLNEAYSGINIALFYNYEMVGGATLSYYQNLIQDKDISTFWEINHLTSGTRISRLWVKNIQHESPLPHLFDAILKNVPLDSFLYGILSLPLNYARSRQEMFLLNNDWLKPLTPLEDCDWPEKNEASSEGRRLLKTYLSLGASFLGTASGDAKNSSVKVVMGINRSQQDVMQGMKHA